MTPCVRCKKREPVKGRRCCVQCAAYTREYIRATRATYKRLGLLANGKERKVSV